MVCLESYQHHGRSADGAAAARSLLLIEKFDDAERVAKRLLAGDHEGDASMVLGSTEARRPGSDLGLSRYRAALAAYLRTGNHAGASRAAHELARVWALRGDLQRATEASQLAIDEAEQGGDLVMQQYARLGHSHLLRRQGLLVAAEAGLARVAALSRTPRDRAWVALLRGILYIDMNLDGLARAELDRVQQLAAGSRLPPEIVVAAHLNLAWIDRRAGQLHRARSHVEAAAAIDRDDVDVHVNRALVLADQGDLGAAAAELRRAAAAESEAGHSWWVAYNQGLVAARRGEVAEELAAFERSSEAIRQLATHAGAYAPDVAASHRQPYLRLIGVHARAGRWMEVLGLVLELDALALLATERAPSHGAASEPPAAVAPAPRRPPPELATVLAAWRSRRLSILVSDEVSLWRIDVRDGQVTGAVVGAADALEKFARTLEANPGDRAAADALGAALVSPAAAAARSPLELLLIGPIARVPLAALTHEGRYLSDRTPLARVLGILPRRKPAPTLPHTGVAILGDPRDNLPGARLEATAVAAALQREPLLGRAATSAALRAASSVELLHVAAHAVLEPRGPVLLLADRAVGRAELLAQPTAPSVVVLASCGGAIARDDTGWGSLAGAYLAAGTDVVIASAWSIDDADTRRFVEQLYRVPATVRGDPVRALAAAQAATRATLPARAWASFTAIAAPPHLSSEAM